jgi:hypothetical protein
VQIPAVQTWEAAQGTLQPPQWAASLLTSVHPVPQSTSPGEQPVVSWSLLDSALDAEQPKAKARTNAPVNGKRARCLGFGEP